VQSVAVCRVSEKTANRTWCVCACVCACMCACVCAVCRVSEKTSNRMWWCVGCLKSRRQLHAETVLARVCVSSVAVCRVCRE